MKVVISDEEFNSLGCPDINDRVKIHMDGLLYSGMIVGLRYLTGKRGVSLNLYQFKKIKS